MKTFKTARGTELPILDLRGKDYLQVAHRLVWFREEKPLWSIETEFLKLEADFAIARATIKDESSRIISTATKFENAKGFPDFMEKAETGSVGRALAMVGYGTQFCADELEEGDRVVDSPLPPLPKQEMLYPYPVPEGLKGRTIASLASDELVKAESNLLGWKTGKNKATFNKNSEVVLKAIQDRLPVRP